MRRLIVLAVQGFMILLFTSPVHSAVYYVSHNGIESNDGLSWATAKASPLNILYKLAASGDEVWMAAGSYDVWIGSAHWKPGVSLYGGFAGNETSKEQRNSRASVTYLRMEGVFTAEYTSSTRIDGFTFRQGITCDNSSPTITNNVFTFVKGLSTTWPPALTCKNASPFVSGNIFMGKTAVIDCLPGSAPVIKNNIIAYGGGINCNESSPQIVNNTIVGNALPTWSLDEYYQGTGDGAAIRCSKASPVVANNIIAFNTTGVYADPVSHPVFKNNCFYKNGRYDVLGQDSPVGKDGNISSDPVLADSIYGNLHIQQDSPCKDAGDDSFIDIGSMDVDMQKRIQGDRVDIGADESDGTSRPEMAPRVVYVKPGGSDSNDGSSWETAKATVKAGLGELENEAGQVWVAAGTYKERIELPARVYLYGGFAGNEVSLDQRDLKANLTILDGEDKGVVIGILPGGYQMTGIDGLVVQNGYRRATAGFPGSEIVSIDASPVITNNVLRHTSFYPGIEGSAMFFYNSAALVSGNTIKDTMGDGIGANNSTLVISRNLITNNRGLSICCGNGAHESVIGPCDLTVEDNTIVGNRHCISTRGGSALVSRNVFADNGGVLWCDSSSITAADNCITGNGGCVFYRCPSANLINNKITGNRSNIEYSSSSGLVANNTIAFFTTNYPVKTGAVRCIDSSPTIANNIIAFSLAGISKEGNSNPNIKNNCVFGNDQGNYIGFPADLTGENGNISADPMFANAETADIHILPDSPCVNAGTNAVAVTNDVDIDGQPRIWGGYVDMGADEYWPLSVQIDIRPGEFPNFINTSGKGLVSVAVLTTPTFNALSVDPASLVFAGASPASRGNGSMVSRKDVDGDGDLDLLAQFCSSDLHLFPSVKSASLVGKIAGGDYVEGFDSVVVAK